MARGLGGAKELLLKGIKQAFVPNGTKLKVWEWADKYRYLDSSSSSEPGRYQTDRTPYLREIMNALSPSDPVQEVVFMKGSQIGATEVGNCWLGFLIDVQPGPVLVVQPTGDLIKRYVKQRFDPMIANCPKLRGKLEETQVRNKSNSMMQKTFPGGFMILTGANSSAGLRSAPVRYIFLDEVDDYPKDVSSQGDVVKLAEARTRTYRRNRKIFMPSSPTVKNHSRIEDAFLTSSQEYYYVPCPDCNEMQILKFGNIRWESSDPANAYYACISCGSAIDEKHKGWMLANGEWRAHAPDVKHRRGFHLSALYSPLGWYSWADAAREFEEARRSRDPQQLKTFVNTVLGETWEERGEVPDWEELYELKEDYNCGTVPDGVLFLTAGIDVQKDRFEMEIVGWGRELESWSIDYLVIKGETATETECWDKLKHAIYRKFKTVNNVELDIRQIAIDSGNQTQQVYNWVRNLNDSKVVAIKGMDTKSQNILMVGPPKGVDIYKDGKRFRRVVKLWPVYVSVIKEEFYSFLRRRKKRDEEDYPAGYCHWPAGYDREHFKQICSEQKASKLIGGRAAYYWEKIYERNEALDCRVYARAAAFILGIDRFDKGDWQELENYHRNFDDIKQKGYNEEEPKIKIVKTDWL